MDAYNPGCAVTYFFHLRAGMSLTTDPQKKCYDKHKYTTLYAICC